MLGLAEALTGMAATMVEAGRQDARHFLQRASEALPLADDLPEPALARHAKTLVSLGRSWERQGASAPAMDCYSQALAELIDIDNAAADETRALLADAARARRG